MGSQLTMQLIARFSACMPILSTSMGISLQLKRCWESKAIMGSHHADHAKFKAYVTLLVMEGSTMSHLSPQMSITKQDPALILDRFCYANMKTSHPYYNKWLPRQP